MIKYTFIIYLYLQSDLHHSFAGPAVDVLASRTVTLDERLVAAEAGRAVLVEHPIGDFRPVRILRTHYTVALETDVTTRAGIAPSTVFLNHSGGAVEWGKEIDQFC